MTFSQLMADSMRREREQAERESAARIAQARLDVTDEEYIRRVIGPAADRCLDALCCRQCDDEATGLGLCDICRAELADRINLQIVNDHYAIRQAQIAGGRSTKSKT